MTKSVGEISYTRLGTDKSVGGGDVLKCVHCDRHWQVRPGSGIQRGYCMLCAGPHCGSRACWECQPFKRKLELEGRF